jgi:hypothetical protein
VARKTVKRKTGSSDGDKPVKVNGLRERLTNSTETADEHLARIDAALAHLKTEATSPGGASLQFLLQFPNEAMHERIAFFARASGRSVNAEIIDRLQRSFADRMPVNDAIAELYDRVRKLEGAVKEHADRLNIPDND